MVNTQMFFRKRWQERPRARHSRSSAACRRPSACPPNTGRPVHADRPGWPRGTPVKIIPTGCGTSTMVRKTTSTALRSTGCPNSASLAAIGALDHLVVVVAGMGDSPNADGFQSHGASCFFQFGDTRQPCRCNHVTTALCCRPVPTPLTFEAGPLGRLSQSPWRSLLRMLTVACLAWRQLPEPYRLCDRCCRLRRVGCGFPSWGGRKERGGLYEAERSGRGKAGSSSRRPLWLSQSPCG